MIICLYRKLPNHKQNDCPKSRQDNSKHVVYVKGKNVRSKTELFHNIHNIENESNMLKNGINHIYSVSFKDAYDKVSIVVKGYRDTGANICVVKENIVPKEFLTLLNKIIDLTGSYAGLNTAPLFHAKVESPIVNGEIDVSIVSSACNFPYNSSLWGKTMVRHMV